MVVGQQNANGIKSSLHDRSSAFSKITRYCFEQEMIGKQSRRGHAKQIRCPLPAQSTISIFLSLFPTAASYPINPRIITLLLTSTQLTHTLYPSSPLSSH